MPTLISCALFHHEVGKINLVLVGSVNIYFVNVELIKGYHIKKIHKQLFQCRPN